jgi:hypothetical protein
MQESPKKLIQKNLQTGQKIEGFWNWPIIKIYKKGPEMQKHTLFHGK